MNWLIWKDYRLNRLVFILAVLLLIAPHVMATVLTLRGMGNDMGQDWPVWVHNFMMASLVSLAFVQLAVAFVGGNAIACERQDRSAEFLATLPVSRGRKLASKLLVTLALLALVWLPNLMILGLAIGKHPLPEMTGLVMRCLGTVAVIGFTFFCVAWCFSSLLDSPTFSVCAGLMVPMVVGIGIAASAGLFEVQLSGDVFRGWFCGLCLAISAATFPAGTLYYLRRVEP
jgi:ABC-type transport system involved in multi-copper enzyme maturation permease subunit